MARLLAALLIVGAAALVAATPLQAREVTLRLSDRDRPVELVSGDTLNVQLTEPPGSQWRLDANDPSVLRFTGAGRVVNVRGRMERLFTLEGVGRGTVSLRFSLVRMVRGRPMVEDIFRVPVTVRWRDGGPRPGGASETVVLTESANGTQVRVSRGDIVVVQLRTQVIKGYHWVRTQGDSSVLRPLGDGRRLQNRRGQWVTEFRMEAVRGGRAWTTFNFRNPRVRGRDPLSRDFSFGVEVARWGFGPR